MLHSAATCLEKQVQRLLKNTQRSWVSVSLESQLERDFLFTETFLERLVVRGLTRLTAALQNPDGLTQPNGVTADPNFTLQGLTVGIYNEKYVFAGPAPAGITAGNPNRGYTSGVSGLTFEAYGFSAASMVIGYTATIYYGVTGGTVG
jgi:hypothetical protein